jgi:two-component system, NarL family, sensor histidine kinase BarA
MFKRLRNLKISLAAKCQILFGAAVILIISAALYVPWKRMDGLIHDVNLQTAEGLATQARMEHLSRQRLGQPDLWMSAAARPSTIDDDVNADPNGFVWPRIIAAGAAKSPGVGMFERAALAEFEQNPSRMRLPFNYTLKKVLRYRLAVPLYNTDSESCLQCHANTAATTMAASMPSILPIERRFLGEIVVDIPSKENENELFLNRAFILLAGVMAGALATGVLYLITTRLILQPVRVLQETAEKVSEGDLNIRSDISTGDEFQQLSETFNTMLANLKSGDDQLRSINKALDLKLSQLAESNVALYESNRLKSEFLANVSHELRTPLNSILGFAELLRETVAKDGDGKPTRYLQNILLSGRNLLELINDLLDLAKIEAGRMDVRSEPLSLGDVFEGLINLLKPLGEQKTVTIVPNVASEVPIVHTDPAKVQQVLYNLLSNAIKFSPVGGRIDLTARMEGVESVKIMVQDHGPGVEPEKREVIFEKFRQIDGSVTREHSGTGLGLSISKELTVLLGGTIGVDSVLGQGATFWILLPLKIQPGQRDVRQKLVLS